MSVVLNDKPRQTTLKWRWPLSRQLTLSVATTAVLLAVWWAVAALQLISPLFLPPPPDRCCRSLSPSPGRRALWMRRSGSTWRRA